MGEYNKIVAYFQTYDIMKSAKIPHFSGKQRILGVFRMYIASNNNRLTIEGIFLSFGDKLFKKQPLGEVRCYDALGTDRVDSHGVLSA